MPDKMSDEELDALVARAAKRLQERHDAEVARAKAEEERLSAEWWRVRDRR